MNGEPRPRRAQLGLALLAALLVVAVASLPWNLEALAGPAALGEAFERLAAFLGAFGAPDLSPGMLRRVGVLAAETLAVALLGVGLGLLLAWPLAVGAARCVVLGEDPHRGAGRWLRRLLLQCCRLALDLLRGVPDFVWAIVLATFLGPNAATGALAIGVSVAGILGKVLSEQWDNVAPQRYQALRSTGARGLQIFLHGIQPLSARGLLSFVLMRTECAVRNASVIGVVGGGGLGAALWDEYTAVDREQGMARMVTVLLAMLLLTAATDLLANLLRYQLRVDPNHPRAPRALDVRASTTRRALGVLSALGLVAAAAAWLRPAFAIAFERPPEWSYVASYVGTLAVPDLSAPALAAAAREAWVPLAVALIATVAATVLAGLLAFPASLAFQVDAFRFTGERLTPLARARRWVLLVGTRAAALVLRAIPEVAWVTILGVFFRQGLTPCVLAVVLHSTGVLLRVFTETVDDIPYRTLEQVAGTCRPQMFVYGALPTAAADWKTYAFFQFEVNVRIGVVLGWVGAGGLGEAFDTHRQWNELHRAGTFLWAMVLLTVLIDRLSRRLLLRRLKC